MSERVLRVGIIGCGEVAQVVHIPTINCLSHRFHTTYLCDVSKDSLSCCSQKVQGGPVRCTTDAAELCSSSEVDVVVIANADAFHVEHSLLALSHDKSVLLEKPAALCFRDIDELIAAEVRSKGTVFVGTMRRFAPVFVDAVREVGGMDRIQYARVRDIIGPNSVFVGQSATYPQKFSDFPQAAGDELKAKEIDIVEQALVREFGVKTTPRNQTLLRLLGGLGTHDLSAMREIIGMPKRVAGFVPTFPGILCALFEYEGFPVTYETGINNIPEFDAHIEVYSADKIVRVDYDTPYVKGLPVTMTIRERVGDGGFQKREIRKTFVDPYTNEYLRFYDLVARGEKGEASKTNIADARKDLEMFKMLLQAADKQAE